MTSKFIVLLITSFIYVLVLVGFRKAKQKFAGGKIAALIGLVITTVVLLFVADYVLLFEPFFSGNTIFIAQTLFRTAALSCLAFGGIRIAAD
jgi:multisubunit Na+/H+ antiporter MnhB subunit